MSNQSQALQKWEQAVALAEPTFKQIAAASGNVVTFAQESVFAMQAIRKNDYLQKCSLQSIRDAILNVALTGITLNPVLALAYLVPRDGVAVLDVSYRGLLYIATGSGSIVTGKAVIVRANDVFEFNGPFENPTHKFDPFASREIRGAIIGCYCVAKLHDGSVQVDTMGMERVDEIRSRSKAYNRGGDKKPSGPWVTDEEEMILKTIIKSASKTWPKNDKLRVVEGVLNAHEGMRDEHLQNGDAQTKEAVRLITSDQVKALELLAAEAKMNPARILKAYDIGSLNDLPAEKYEECKERLKQALKAKLNKPVAQPGQTTIDEQGAGDERSAA